MLSRSKLLLWVAIQTHVGLCLGCRGSRERRDDGPPEPVESSALPTANALLSPPAQDEEVVHKIAPNEGPDVFDRRMGSLAPPVSSRSRCPSDMVLVESMPHRLCVDRFEGTLVDNVTGNVLSPYYPPSGKQASSLEQKWSTLRFSMGDASAHELELPILPAWQRNREGLAKAVAQKNVVPHGYMSGVEAQAACMQAGKRLCRLDEWRMACRGEAQRPFPYGARYTEGQCNVFREAHPAAVLHNDASLGHTDPRLNTVRVHGQALLRKTGETRACASVWGADAIYDMVGNLDEWVDDPDGTFVGGFYARANRSGCDATITVHAYQYFDYSLGVRCCMDAR